MPRIIETNQDAQTLPATVPETIELRLQDWRAADGYDNDLTPADRQPWPAMLRLRAHRFDITAQAPDGQTREIWIEIDKGDLVAHCFDPDHDEPLSVRIGATSIAVIDDRAQHGIALDAHTAGNAPAADPDRATADKEA